MIRTASATALLTLLTGVGILTACSYRFCHAGVFPFEGGTAAPDVVLHVRTEWQWSAERLAIGGIVELEGPDGAVPVEVIVDEGRGDVFEVRPLELLPDGEYTLVLEHHQALEDSTSGHYVGDWGPSDVTQSSFTVGGTPRIIGQRTLWSTDEVAVVFSEAVDPASLDGRVFVDGESVTPRAADSRNTVWYVDLPPDEEDEEGQSDDGIRLENGITTVDGEAFVVGLDGRPGGVSDPMERFLGLPWCDE